jgi:transcriptional regulator with XRE-family HTH domain
MVTAAAPVMLPVMSTTPHTRHALPARAACALRAARVERGLSLRETARRAGIGHGFLHAIEAGVKAPGRTRAEALVAVLDPPGWLAIELRDVAERVERGRGERAQARELRRQGGRG